MQIPSLDHWRVFASARYRPFQAIAIGQAFTTSFAADALFVPLLLRLGAPPSLVILIGSMPFTASVVQALQPQILRRMRGNLRRLTLVLSLAELRGFVYAAIVAGIALGWIDPRLGIVLIALTVAFGQTAGILSGVNITFWTAVVLAEHERRMIGPRVGAATMAISTVLLLPSGVLLDVGLRSIGIWAYACFYVVGGLASILTPLAINRLPPPGRVLVKSGEEASAPLPEPFRRFTLAMVVAGIGQGLIPYGSMYAIDVLGASPGFSVALSGATSAGALIGSLITGSFLALGSSSRVLRASFLTRVVAAMICAASIPGNPAALPMLVVGSALFFGAGTAGTLASNERLYRLAPPGLRVRCQSYYVATSSAAIGVGAVVCAGALLLTGPLGWGVYSALYLSSGVARLAAAARMDVSPTWRSPSAQSEAQADPQA